VVRPNSRNSGPKNLRPMRAGFRGPDGQPLMEPVNLWTVQDMLRAAEELQVPLYDDKSWKQPGQGRLVYDPAVGPAARRKLPVPDA
jgi:hypothetical protein